MAFELVGQGRLELPTYGLGNHRSVQLSYCPSKTAEMIAYLVGDVYNHHGAEMDLRGKNRLIARQATSQVAYHAAVCQHVQDGV